jgi:hypothetical protein
LPKTKKYINTKGDIIKIVEKEQSEEEPSEEVEKKTKKKKKIKKKENKPKVMITEDGKKVQVLDDENEPSEIRIDESTGKPIPKKKKIKNENGEIEEVKEIIKDKDELSEYDEETGKKNKKIYK